eukprot:77246-Amorphochlora_amoeboformis.AAC.1
MKFTDTGGFAHLVCAMCVTETSFDSFSVRPRVSCIQRIFPARRQPRCMFCQKPNCDMKPSEQDRKTSPDSPSSHSKAGKETVPSHQLDKTGACIQCSYNECEATFHAQCAQDRGCLKMFVARAQQCAYVLSFDAESGVKNVVVRSKPEAEAKVVGQLMAGAIVHVLERQY